VLELSYVGCMLSFKFEVDVGTNNVQVWGRGARELKRFKKNSLKKMINNHTKCVEKNTNKNKKKKKEIS